MNVCLGFVAYIHGEIPSSNARFWENALQNVLEREEKTTKDFLAMDKNEQARIAFLLIDYPVTILPYIGDQVDRRNRKSGIAAAVHQGHLKVGYENFGEVLALMGGDCEDLAKGITKVARALKIFLQSPGASPQVIGENMGKTSLTCLTRINELLDQFVIQMSLCVVHGAKADDNSSMPKGAHMADMGFPVKYFKDCLERTREGQRISAHLPWPKVIEDGLDFQIGEGTGLCQIPPTRRAFGASCGGNFLL
jgi:hypothetical protein